MKVAGMVFFTLSSALLAGCPKTMFQGSSGSGGNVIGNTSTTSNTQTGTALSPQETDANKTALCTNNYRAVRIAFVIDNSGSNGLKTGAVQSGMSMTGTDPVRNGTSARGLQETYTDRQNALYSTVTHTMDLDRDASSKNSNFIGTDLGVASFPASADNLDAYTLISGNASSGLPGKMTNMKTVQNTPTLTANVWQSLDFTHHPDGATPYLTALNAAEDLLKNGRTAGDLREDYIFLITDGLPTDEQPSLVVSKRAALTNTHLIQLSVFQPGATITSQNADAASALQNAFQNQNWGRRPGHTDGFQNFSDYWTALLNVPSQIADLRFDVTDSTKLAAQLDSSLQVIRQCN